MQYQHWTGALLDILRRMEDSSVSPVLSNLRENVNAYAVPSFDSTALQFAFPISIEWDLATEFGYPAEGSDGAVGAILERIKLRARERRELGPLCARGVAGAERFADLVEPCTIIHSERTGETSLWRPDRRNFFQDGRLFLTIRGAIPWPGPPAESAVKMFGECLDGLLHAISEEAMKVPEEVIREWWIVSLDQKHLRALLPAMGLVSFIGDGSRPAREYTRYRCIDAIAGPKCGVNVPFRCPEELDPVEVPLWDQGDRITGLGIRRGEVFGIIGSNAEGKSTLLQAIISGEDDHAPGDGRERIVTVRGSVMVEAVETGLRNADVSLFFKRLPPGVSGNPRAASGMGSASLCMAAQIHRAVSRQAPLILIDEDRAAANLLVPSCMQSEDVMPLSSLLVHNRSALGGITIIFAAGALDLLIAQADRLLLLQNHAACALDRGEFRRRLRADLQKTLMELSGE